MAEPKIERLKELLVYTPSTGSLVWGNRPDFRPCNKARWLGKQAGGRHKDGYVQLIIDGKHLLGHRVAWAMFYGAWPADQIDHKNGQRDDNRIANLRDASRNENARNRKISTQNCTGYKGVVPHQGKYRAKIKKDGKRYHLGTFESPEDAHAAYCAEASRLHGDFARHS